jgi:hypothetical protein
MGLNCLRLIREECVNGHSRCVLCAKYTESVRFKTSTGLHGVTFQNIFRHRCVSLKSSSVGFVRSEFLTAVVMKSYIFWDITSCGPLKINRCFGGTCRLNLHDRRIRQEKIGKAFYLLHAGFLLDLFFAPEVGGDLFLRNVG